MALSTTESSTKSGTSNVAVAYVGGPLGGQHALYEVGGEAGELPGRRDGHGGHYELDQRDGHEQAYVWHADADLADGTPADGDAASRLLEDNGGATPVLDQDVTSSTTVASGAVPAESLAQRQTKGPKRAAVEEDEARKAGVDTSTSPRTQTDVKGTSKPGTTTKS